MREASTEHARLVLAGEGFKVEDIPEAPPNKRADLRVWAGEEEYIVEAKLRAPHDGWLELMKKVGAEGYASTSRQIDPWSSLSSTILQAHAQLAATPAGPGAFRVLWAVALHADDGFVISCLEKRLLGSVQIVLIDPMALKVGDIVTCYHHASNDFERCPQLDAAVLGTRTGANLFINYFSERRAALRASRLHGVFDAHGAVVDPEVQAASGKAYMLGNDFEGPRDGKTQAAYLRKKHGIMGNVMMEFQFAGMAMVPRAGTP
jgi:hypothetical protein